MKDLFDGLRPIVAAVLALVMGNCEAGCAPFNPGKVPDRLYEAQIAACVTTATSLRNSCECRKDVDYQWDVCLRPEDYPGNSCLKDCESL
jgi:hypothetical protein